MVRGVEQGGAAMSSSSSSSLSPSPVSAPAGQTAITFRGIAAVAGVLITFAALTLIVLLHCYCDEWRRGALTTSASGRGRRRRSGSGGDGGRGGGVDPEVLPVTVYSRAAAAAAAAEGSSSLVIEIPESAASTPRDAAARSWPSLARLRSLRRLWSLDIVMLLRRRRRRRR
uniref:Uncharacterized protein n=1 Tax=Oryza rufipogon TaxID=4529 RepID=A0A0E0NGG7_ORYRU